jgi:hypothetical protein
MVFMALNALRPKTIDGRGPRYLRERVTPGPVGYRAGRSYLADDGVEQPDGARAREAAREDRSSQDGDGRLDGGHVSKGSRSRTEGGAENQNEG